MNIYYYMLKGLIGVGSILSLHGYYTSLCHNMVTLYKMRNPVYTRMKGYMIYPMIYSMCSMLVITFALNDVGIMDRLVDGITDGSLSELIHIFAIFMMVPYAIHSLWIIYFERKKIIKQDTQESLIEIGILSDKDLYYRYVCLILVFLFGVIPSCLAEFIPMAFKFSMSSFGFIIFANVSAVLFSFSGFIAYMVRLIDPYLRTMILESLNKHLGIEPMPMMDFNELIAGMKEETKNEEIKSDKKTNNYERSFTSSIKQSRISHLTMLSSSKSSYNQVEKFSAYEVNINIILRI